ncbi:MAG: hypothetical protein ACLPJY_09120, partial [Rhodomicrobium sp.]
LELFGALHALEFAVFDAADLGIGKRDFVLQGSILLVGLYAACLLAKLEDLLLLILDIAFKATPLGFLFLDCLLGLFESQLFRRELLLKLGKMPGKSIDFAAQPGDVLIGFLNEY